MSPALSSPLRGTAASRVRGGVSAGTPSGVSSLDCGAADPCHASGGAAFSEEAREARMLAEYLAGYSLLEVAGRHGLSSGRTCNILSAQPAYRPRAARRIGRAALAAVCVPDWVPGRHHARYRRIAATNDEECAAACLRRMKRLEASA